jgi:adenylate cyclase
VPARPQDPAEESDELTLAQVADAVGISASTIRRWVSMGLVPGHDGRWTQSTVAYLRVVARLRERGHTLEEIKSASDSGQLVSGPIETLLKDSGPRYTLKQASRECGMDAKMIARIFTAMGLSVHNGDGMSEEDVQILKYAGTVIEAGFPLDAYLQLMRVYGQKIAQIADAEVRLIHLYVHEPLMRAGVPSAEIAEELEGLTRDVLPLAAPLMNYLHGRLLAEFVEQDMIGHMEADIRDDAPEEGRLRVAIAFADLAGFARLTVERGDEAAVGTVERFAQAAGESLPMDARVVKTLGDEVMVVASDAAGLTAWAVALQSDRAPAEPPARIGIHVGEVLYRDGDYYGREVNQAARVVARAGPGEVLVTRPVVDVADGIDGVRFTRIGEVRLKGFSEPTELFTAAADG